MYKTVQHYPNDVPDNSARRSTYMHVDMQGEKELLVPIAHLGQGRFWNLQLKLTPEQTTSLIFGLVDLDLFVMQATLDAPDVRLVDKDRNVLVFDPRQNSIEIWLHPSVDQGLRRAVAARLTRTLLTVAGLTGLWESASH